MADDLPNLEEIKKLRETSKDTDKAIKNINIELKELYKNAEDNKDRIKELNDELDSLEEQSEKTKDAINQINSSFKEGEKIASDMAAKIGLVDKGFGKAGSSGDKFGVVLKGIKSKSKDLLNPLNIALNVASLVLGETIKRVQELDKSIVDLKKNVGAFTTDKFRKEIMGSYNELKLLGFTADQVFGSAGSVIRGTANFSKLTEVQRNNLINLTTKMERLGVKGETTAASFEYLTTAAGLAPEEAIRSMISLTNLSDELQMSVGEIASELVSTQASFARYGDNAIDTFVRTRIAARRLGLEMSDLINISEGFDTFEQAGQNVGQLNAILGGPFLNAIDMIKETDPVERLNKIREAILLSGDDFETMTERQKQAIAQRIPGIGGDVSKLSKLLRDMDQGLIQTVDDIKASVDATDSSMGKLTERAISTMTLADAFEAFKSAFAFTPDEMNFLMNGFKGILITMAGLGNALSFVTTGISKLMSGLKAFYNIVSGGTKKAAATARLQKMIGGGTKIGAEAGLGVVAKKIPGLSLVTGAILGGLRFMRGDIVGGIAEITSGIAGSFPGIGTAISMGIDAALLSGDLGLTTSTSQVSSGLIQGFAEGGIVTKPTLAVIGEGGENEFVVPESKMDKLITAAVNTSLSTPATSNTMPANINVTIALDGRELKNFVKKTTFDTLNPVG